MIDRATVITPEEISHLRDALVAIRAARRSLGNALVLCHCGSGRKRGWWKPFCSACEKAWRQTTIDEGRAP
jgi:hypothetical protein